MSTAPGQHFGPYEILAPIGAGGMGEVFRARDTRLKRTVAIKVLPAEHSGAADRRARFELEARAISSLNHPHICSLFDIGEEGGRRFLVMEYLEGETLANRIRRGRLPVTEALAIGIQIGEALSHAHQHGVVHRDLKPDNIMLTGVKRSHSKLLDFGLVKIVARAAAAGVHSPSDPTLTLHRSVEGTIAGTIQYMSPEQLDGREADTRSDVFAFGAVLYEMLTGRPAFEGSSTASLISSILRDTPAPIRALEPASPAALDRVIRKCLAKDPAERWQSAHDLTDDLTWIAESGSETVIDATPVRARGQGARAGWAVAAVLAVLLIAVAAIALSTRTVAPTQAQGSFEVRLPEKMAFGGFDYPVLSPDGSRLVFPAEGGPENGRGLLMRRLDSLEIQRLPATEGATFPFWSPDGRQVAFFANGKLKRVDITGGSPVTIADAPSGIGGSWNRDGVIVFCPKLDSPLHRVNASGGIPVQLTKLDAARRQTSQFFPEFLPDGRHFVFYGVSAGREEEFNAAYVGSLDSQDVTYLFKTMGRVMYTPGYLLVPQGDSLMAAPFDARTLRTTGEPSLVLERVGHVGAVLGSAFTAANGTLAYRSGAENLPVLTWLNRRGEKLAAVAPAGEYGNPSLSRDETNVAVDHREGSGRARALWMIDTSRGTRSRLTFDAGDHFNAIWSPDGTRIAFTCTRTGTRDLFQKLANGRGEEELLLITPNEKNLEDWSADGRYLLFNTRESGKPIEIWALPLFGDRKPFRVIAAGDNCEQARFSPDGKWIAYTSIELRRQEIFVQEFPPSGGKWQISSGGGIEPQWRRDSRELYFLQGNKLMAVDVRTSGGQFQVGTPRPLFETGLRISGRNSYAVARDGQRFLVNLAGPEHAVTGFTVITNWRK